MDQKLSNYFFREAAMAFDFLVKNYSFAPPQLDVDNKINFTTVTFMGKNLAVECIFDEREVDIDCKIARVIDGQKTSHYAVDDKGNRVREGVFHLLHRRGINERLFTPTKELDVDGKIKTTLNDFAQMIRKHGRNILADSPDALA
jgi:hypothetical protein